jgi:hypothetical protein
MRLLEGRPSPSGILRPRLPPGPSRNVHQSGIAAASAWTDVNVAESLRAVNAVLLVADAAADAVLLVVVLVVDAVLRVVGTVLHVVLRLRSSLEVVEPGLLGFHTSARTDLS